MIKLIIFYKVKLSGELVNYQGIRIGSLELEACLHFTCCLKAKNLTCGVGPHL